VVLKEFSLGNATTTTKMLNFEAELTSDIFGDWMYKM